MQTAEQILASIDHLREGVQLVDRQWRYLYVNPAAAAHGGTAPDRLVGRTMMECFPGIEGTDLFRALERVMQSGCAESFSNPFTDAAGRERWFDLRIGPAPEGLCILSLDVTNERAAVQSHQAYRDRAAFAIDAAEAGVWEFDLLSGTVRWTHTIGCMLGRAGTFEGGLEDFRRMVHPDDQQLVDSAIARSIERLEPYRADFRVVWPDQSVHWLTAKGRVTTRGDGKPEGLVGIAIDITGRKLLELQLQQAQKMESLGQLAGSIAHDFNNVLTAILGFSDLLLDETAQADPRRATLQEIHKAAESGHHLTKQLLAFSRRQPLEPKLVQLNEVVSRFEGILRQLLGKGVELVSRLAPDLPQVYADAGQMQQILANLAVNARDAMPKGGRFVIETTQEVRGEDNVTVRGRSIEPGRYVVLIVTDTGTGMSPEILPRVFEPFFTTKAGDKGTGLGLSTVYGIVRQSGGYVDLTSAPAAGTTFRIGLPAA